MDMMELLHVRTSPRPSAIENLVASFVAPEGASAWWRDGSNSFGPSFVKEIETIAEKGVVPAQELWPWYVLDALDSERQ